jgi:hypothetical protein
MTPASPLLFAQILNAPGLWKDLGKTHGLSEKDFNWLAHINLATDTLRSEQTPPLLAERILIELGTGTPVELAGAFVLSATPDEKAWLLYTPYDGLKKHHSRADLETALIKRLQDADEEDNLLAFLAFAQRRRVVDAASITLTLQTIKGDVFEAQTAALSQAQQLNAQAMADELKQLPSLNELLERALDKLLQPSFGALAQRNTRVSFYTLAPSDNDPQPSLARYWLDSMSLSDAVLRFYRHPHWPADQQHEFSNPGRTPLDADQQTWDNAVATAASKLPALLFEQLEAYWDAASADGANRRTFFAEALASQARTDLLQKRESNVITASQFNTVHQIVKQNAGSRRPTIETVQLWEHQANYVEPAGSLMIGDSNAFLYTPSSGLQVLADYQDLKKTLLSKFSTRGHEDEMYALLSLDEQGRFLGFDKPNVSGEMIAGEIFEVLFEAILTKQRENLLYTLQVFRHSEGSVDIYALFDKALDIRAMLHERLLTLASQGRWSTRPVLAGGQQPSSVLADAAALAGKSYASVASRFDSEFSAQPLSETVAQRAYLEGLRAKWVDALSVGVRGEARMRRLQSSLSANDQAIIDTVLNGADRSRRERGALNGFRPDAYALTVLDSHKKQRLPLAGSFLLTERGGLDDQHSGRAILWTAAMGLEPFDNLAEARQALGRRLADSVKRQSLLENLTPEQWQPHENYSLGPFWLIEEDVLQNRIQSAIDHCLAHADSLRKHIKDTQKQAAALKRLTLTAGFTNLPRAAGLSDAIYQQQTLPAWLGMAPIEEQKLHLELLEQWHNSVSDDKDYLDGIPTLKSFVQQRLKTLLNARFPAQELDPGLIEITPNLALAGPPRSLTEFALNHVNTAQGTGFKIASKTPKALPKELDQNAVKQLLLSLNIGSTYASKVAEKLSATDAEGSERQRRFFRQLPWQLMQHAHALKLQGELSAAAFDSLTQVLDMPDGTARASVTHATAIIAPLSLIKTVGAQAVEAQGLYVVSSGGGQAGPLVLFTPYADPVFHEFESAAKLIDALNTPGALQELLLRRLPTAQQAVFRSLLQSSVGETSEMTLATRALDGQWFAQFFSDNTALIKQFLNAQSKSKAQPDWDVAKSLLRAGIQRLANLLPGKLAYLPFLWRAYNDFKDSAENLQNHHWRRALRSFINGAVEMVSLGWLALEDDSPRKTTATRKTPEAPVSAPKKPAAPSKKFVPDWKDIKPTSPLRTPRQAFAAPAVALKDLSHDAKKGIYEDAASKKTYAAIDGQVLRVKKNGADWHLHDGSQSGPSLRKRDDTLVLDPDLHPLRTGKVFSRLSRRDATRSDSREALNIEARGMTEIRRKHPLKAWMLVQAVDLARYYAFNGLHNLAQLKNKVPNPRVDTFLKGFFDVTSVDTPLLEKIHNAMVPICNALVDPTQDLMNTDRFVIGSNKYPQGKMSAFVYDDDAEKKVHFTELFFESHLDWYKTGLTEPFNVEGHAQAALLIHEFAHIACAAEDITMLEARRPFADLISTTTPKGLELKQAQQDFQRGALSLATPRDQLFRRWDSEDETWVSFDKLEGVAEAAACKGILAATSSSSLAEARNAFLDQNTPDARIKTILLNADSLAMLICEMGRKLDS